MTPPSARFLVRPIGIVRSTLSDATTAPKQGDEGAPDAWIDVAPRFAAAVDDIAAGDRLIVLSWLHLADRNVVRVRPRDDPLAELRGVFSTRSASRPNPIGLHEVVVRGTDGHRLQVGPLELVDGTPILDIKPVL